MAGKIWLFVDSSGIGGIERHIATLATGLCERGLATEIVLYQDHGDNPWLEQLARARLPFRILGGGLSALNTALSTEAPALLHAHGYKAGILARFAALPRRIPVVSTFHAGERGPFPVSLYQWLDGWTSLPVHRIAVSRQIKENLPFGATLIPNFIGGSPRTPRAHPRTIAFVGRFSSEKAPDLFCEIAAQASHELKFVAYGEGAMRASLEKRYASRVTFRGLVADMDREWPKIGLLLMPSRAEGLPMAALEALDAGIPIAASNVGDLANVVHPGETGWLFAPGDMAAACNAIEAFTDLSESERDRMTKACWSLADRQFGMRRDVESILAVYRKAGLALSPAALEALPT
jgi:glycosyltransferase involved in cell wall biosynthesis